MSDSFQKTKEGIPVNDTEDLEFDLCFDCDMPPHGYTTERGNRYEQPGTIKGKISIGKTCVDFNGKGIRDHSWEIRNIPSWGEYYALMGRFGHGVLACGYMNTGDKQLWNGWVRKDECSDITMMHVDPAFSEGILEECHMTVETVESTLEIDTRLLSFVIISMGKEQEKVKAMESLVELSMEKYHGYGFLWYGGVRQGTEKLMTAHKKICIGDDEG